MFSPETFNLMIRRDIIWLEIRENLQQIIEKQKHNRKPELALSFLTVRSDKWSATVSLSHTTFSTSYQAADCSLRNITKLGRHKHNYYHLISTPIGSKHLLYPAGNSLCWSGNIYCCDVIEFNVFCGLPASFPLSRPFILNYFQLSLSDCDPTKKYWDWDI